MTDPSQDPLEVPAGTDARLLVGAWDAPNGKRLVTVAPQYRDRSGECPAADSIDQIVEHPAQWPVIEVDDGGSRVGKQGNGRRTNLTEAHCFDQREAAGPGAVYLTQAVVELAG